MWKMRSNGVSRESFEGASRGQFYPRGVGLNTKPRQICHRGSSRVVPRVRAAKEEEDRRTGLLDKAPAPETQQGVLSRGEEDEPKFDLCEKSLGGEAGREARPSGELWASFGALA